MSSTERRATLQQVLLQNREAVSKISNTHVRKVLHHLSVCRTAALGYHLYSCEREGCNGVKYQYHSLP